MKKKMKRVKNRIKKEWDFMCNNPKEYWIGLYNICREYVKNNTLFVLVIVASVINGALVRAITSRSLMNFFYLKPMIADFAIATLFASFCYLFKAKNRFIYLFSLSGVFTAICIINAIYYTYYSSFASVSMLSTGRFIFEMDSEVVGNVIHLVDWIYLWEPIALLLVYLKLKKSKKYYDEENIEFSRLKFKHSIYVVLGAVLAFCVTLDAVQIGRFGKLWNREYVVHTFGLYTYHIDDLVKSIEPKLTTLFGYDRAMKIFTEFYDDVSDTKTYTNEYTDIFKGKNIIVIHAESMMNDVIGLKFNGLELTPNLNQLASESLYFSNYYSQVSIGTSSDTEFTFNTSLMPTNNGTAFVSYFDREYVSIPKLLKEQGYYTFAMHANNGSFWNRNVMHQSLGYDDLYDKASYEIDEKIGFGLSDKSFFKQIIEQLKEIAAKEEPYYGTIITLSNHTPFTYNELFGDYEVTMKEAVINEFGEEVEVEYPYLEGTQLGDYYKSVHYADQALGQFFEDLEQNGLLDNTVIVLYGDHDARIDIDEYRLQKNYDKEKNTVLSTDNPNYVEFTSYDYEMNRRVPFIIWSKETKESLHKEVDTVMGMYDAMPTLGNMFGFYNKYALGHDIFEQKEDNIVVFPNGNWVSNKVYYNSQKNKYITLKGSEIDDKYIEKNSKYTDEILDVSNSLIVFDLIKKQRELIESPNYIDERKIKNETTN